MYDEVNQHKRKLLKRNNQFTAAALGGERQSVVSVNKNVHFARCPFTAQKQS